MRATTKAQYDKRYDRHVPPRPSPGRRVPSTDYAVKVPKWSREDFMSMWPVRFCGRMTNGKYIT